MRQNRLAIIAAFCIITFTIPILFKLEYGMVNKLAPNVQRIFIGHRSFYVGIVMSVFTGAVVTAIFSCINYIRSKRDVFEFLTCLYDKINIYIIDSKDNIADGQQREKALMELKMNAAYVLNELKHMLKITGKERAVLEKVEGIMSEIGHRDRYILNFDTALTEIIQVEHIYYSKKYFDSIQDIRKMLYG